MQKLYLSILITILALTLTACSSPLHDIILDDKDKTSVNDIPNLPQTGTGSEVNLDNSKTRAQIVIEDMSLEEKAGQLFLARCPEDAYIENALSLHPGGFVLFKRDFEGRTTEQVIDRIKSFNKNASVPLAIAVDEEGGTVVRISSNPSLYKEPFKSPQELYAEGGMEAVFDDADSKAELLLSLGVNLNLAPVADISLNIQDYIYPRSLGMDALKTADYVKNVVTAMEKRGLSSCLKHFPGYGGNADTHTGLAQDSREYDDFVKSDFLPFTAGIESGAPCVLVSHNIVESMDADRPASLSLSVHEILRRELEFDGIIMTDDVSMDAIAQYTGGDSPAVAAVLAGNDLIITSDFERDYESVLNALKDGSISEAALNDALTRIIEWKYNYGIIK